MTSGHLRRPDPAYSKNNGFREPGEPPVDKDHPDDITIRNVRFAQYILANKGSYVPSYVCASSPALIVLLPTVA